MRVHRGLWVHEAGRPYSPCARSRGTKDTPPYEIHPLHLQPRRSWERARPSSSGHCIGQIRYWAERPWAQEKRSRASYQMPWWYRWRSPRSSSLELKTHGRGRWDGQPFHQEWCVWLQSSQTTVLMQLRFHVLTIDVRASAGYVYNGRR